MGIQLSQCKAESIASISGFLFDGHLDIVSEYSAKGLASKLLTMYLTRYNLVVA